MKRKAWWHWINAATSNDEEKLRKFIGKGVDVNEADSEGQTALSYAIAYNCVDAAKLLVAAGADVNASFADGCTPLDTASTTASPDFYQWLVRCGAKRNWHHEGGAEFKYNNSQFVQTVLAIVKSKRIAIVRIPDALESHFVTFQLEEDLCELGMDEPNYSELQVGDMGTLQMKGFRYIGFD